MTRAAALGFDVGTSAVKAGLLWLDEGGPMLTVSQAHPTSRPRPGWVEQDPRDWIAGMAACWAELRALADPVELRAVGLCAQVNTHLLVDDRLKLLRPAITWQDGRAADVAAGLDAVVADRRETLWGGPFTVDASFSLSRLAWLREHEPAARDAARWLLQPKDYCLAVICGELVADPLSPVGLVGPDGRYLDAVLALEPDAAELLPPIVALDAPAGRTIEGNPVGLPAGVPVAVGTMDAWASLFGAGIVQPGRAMDLAGTSEVVAVASERSVPTPGIVSFPPVLGLRVHAGPTQAGGAALEWVAGLLSLTVAEALALAEQVAREPQPIVFLPHLAGERAPYWNPAARGVFVGLTTSTTPGHLVLAVLEGVAHSVRMLLDRCEVAADTTVRRVRACGGGARSSTWNQLKADATGRILDVLETADAGLLGAALTGIVAAGISADLRTLAEDQVRVIEAIEPRLESAARLAELHEVYRDSYLALEPLFPRLDRGRAG